MSSSGQASVAGVSGLSRAGMVMSATRQAVTAPEARRLGGPSAVSSRLSLMRVPDLSFRNQVSN